MKKRILTILLFMLLVVSSLIIVYPVEAVKVGENTLYVGGSGAGNYTKIQDAIDNASDGDIVFVYDDSSPYKEYIYINKAILLIGENRNTTIIEGLGQYRDIIYLISDSVHISNFTIRNTGPLLDVINDGIILDHSNNVSIKNINFIGCGLSYDFETDPTSFHHKIINNYVNGKPLVYFEDKTNERIDDLFGEVILVNCSNITVSNQNISDLRCGIILYYSNNCHLYKNQITRASYGILLCFSNNNNISENILSFNARGVIYGASSGNIFIKNIIKSNTLGIYDNLSPFIYGISSNNTVKNNIMANNSETGIWLYSQAFIYNNEFISNNWAITIFWITPVERNNFYYNKRDVWICASLSTFSNIIIDSNYWGKSRILPKLNLGVINYAGGIITVIPWFFIDWHPAKVPNKI